MSKKKGDLVYSQFYAPHLGGGHASNPAIQQQALVQRMYIRHLTELAANRFKWVGLPDTIDERFLELNLFWRALTVFFLDPGTDRYLALRGSGAGRVNMYDNPTTFTVVGPGFPSRTLTAKQCVPIWANYMRVPDLDIVTVYAEKLARIDRTIDITVDNLRFTKVITTTENERLSWTNILKQHAEGQPVIFGTQGLDMSQLQPNAFDVGVHPDTLPKLIQARNQLWNQCMTLLGINNANQDKAERLVADEVAANDAQVAASRAIALNARRQAAEQINRLYKGLDVSVDFQPDQAPGSPLMPAPQLAGEF